MDEQEIFRSFRCAQCGAEKEVPIRCDIEQYGWRAGEVRFCSYHCMRAWEKEQLPDARTINGTSRGYSPYHNALRIRAFERLRDYLTMTAVGMAPKDAAEAAGYVTVNAAKTCKKKYGKRDDFLAFCRGEGPC